MEEIKVGTVIIGKQYDLSENYEEFVNMVKEKKINVKFVESGTKINIEKNLYFDVLWPVSEKIISENILNNNSLVFKMVYKDFSILFTGDIEEIAEKEILKTYKGKEKLLFSNVLKIAHHGSKTSTTNEFLNFVNPQIALIGVGKNNLFKHPSEEIIQKLEKRKIRIYRTDKNGEITIIVDKKGKLLLKTIY